MFTAVTENIVNIQRAFLYENIENSNDINKNKNSWDLAVQEEVSTEIDEHNSRDIENCEAFDGNNADYKYSYLTKNVQRMRENEIEKAIAKFNSIQQHPQYSIVICAMSHEP